MKIRRDEDTKRETQGLSVALPSLIYENFRIRTYRQTFRIRMSPRDSAVLLFLTVTLLF